MKIGSSLSSTPGEAKKVNKKPQLALDSAFKNKRSGLKLYIEKPGKGDKIEKGSKVIVHYDGWLAEDYTLFDSSRKKRRPFEFNFGEGNVIQGWEEGLEGLRAGTKLQLKIPANLAYGAQGVPSLKIPPNAELIFKVEILKVK